MPALVAIVFDLSCSWIGHGGPERWLVALCDTIKKLSYQPAPYITTSKDKVFAIGCGCKREPYNFDILRTIRHLQDMELNDGDDVDAILCETMDILQNNGAPYVRDWANENRLKNVVEAKDIKVLWYKLKTDEDFMKTFVYDILPEECRSRNDSGTFVANTVGSSANGGGAFDGTIRGAQGGVAVGWMGLFIGGPIAAADASDRLDHKTYKSIMKTMRKGTDLVWSRILVPVGPESVMNVHDARSVVNGCTSRVNTTQAERKMQRLLKKMKPLIYGPRRMVSAL